LIHPIDRFFGRMPSWQLVLWCTLMVGFVGAIDGITGNELSFVVFYLLPVSVAAWYGGLRVTWGIAVSATFTWLAMEYLADRQYSHQWILFWNSAVRMTSFGVVATLLRQLHAHVDSQSRLARTDPLTGLLNRAGFLERSEALVNSASRYGLSLVIAFIDLDGFKNVNDSLGHTRGDELLRAVGGALGGSIRESDIAGRLGGDEFAVLLPNTDLAGADAYFAKLHRQMLEAMRRCGGPEVGVSIGAMVFEQGPPHLNEALRMADELMYRAKKGGRTSVIVETPPAATRLRSAGDAA
jgi:diguanylate cyclase (GGDEF)-like protein